MDHDPRRAGRPWPARRIARRAEGAPGFRRERVRDELRCAVARARFRERMIDLLGDHDIAVMEIDGFPHPLSAVYRRRTLPHVEALLAKDRLAAGVSVRRRAHPPRAAGGDDLRRSASSDAAQSEYAGGLLAALPRLACRAERLPAALAMIFGHQKVRAARG